MESLPLELWDHVFALACTDSGWTASSLSLTSRAFHYVSIPYRFRHLIAVGRRQLLALADLVHRYPSGIQYVRRVFLADHLPKDARRGHRHPHVDWSGIPPWFLEAPPMSASASSSSTAPYALLPSPATVQHPPAWIIDPRRADAQGDAVAAVVLSIMAVLPTTEELTLVLGAPVSFILPPVELPRLKELTCDYSSRTLWSTPIQPTFPALQRLHVVTSQPHAQIPHLYALAPRLTHFRLSNVRRPSSLVPALKPDASSDSDQGTMVLPRDLRVIDIQASFSSSPSEGHSNLFDCIHSRRMMAATDDEEILGLLRLVPGPYAGSHKTLATWLSSLDGPGSMNAWDDGLPLSDFNAHGADIDDMEAIQTAFASFTFP